MKKSSFTSLPNKQVKRVKRVRRVGIKRVKRVNLLIHLIKRVKYVFFRVENFNLNLTRLNKRISCVDPFN